MYTAIKKYIDQLTKEFSNIPDTRKQLLEKISQYISKRRLMNKPINLIYICTHNSRRSHFGQVWANVAANYYGIKNINSFSGGTEATEFNINAIRTLERIGFTVKTDKILTNPHYEVYYNEELPAIICFSKTYDDAQNPKNEFAAIMTCSDAEENCPFIPGVEFRIGTTYEDPKLFDNTPQQNAKYDERCKQIALETIYVFSKVN
jgi:protein-tyrosine phosphatase/arsenate reductase